jgi:predicted transcriptional regulator
MSKPTPDTLAELTADIVSAYVSKNTIVASELPVLIEQTFETLRQMSQRDTVAEPKAPAVSIKQSVKSDHLVCLECGARFKTIKRHLRTAHDLSPDDYKAKWNLGQDYPIVAPNYAEKRSLLALQTGLGGAVRKRPKK